MITGRENQDLLRQLLVVHLAPAFKADISRALNSYKALRGVRYAVSASELEANLPTGGGEAPVAGAESAPAGAVT